MAELDVENPHGAGPRLFVGVQYSGAEGRAGADGAAAIRSLRALELLRGTRSGVYRPVAAQIPRDTPVRDRGRVLGPVEPEARCRGHGQHGRRHGDPAVDDVDSIMVGLDPERRDGVRDVLSL